MLRARGTTKRSAACPMGDSEIPCVSTGNVMVARCCLLIMLAAARGCFWLLEQPRGSLLESHPCVQLLMRKLTIYRKHIRMSEFGAESEKGTWLYSGDGFQKPTTSCLCSANCFKGLKSLNRIHAFQNYCSLQTPLRLFARTPRNQ